MPEASAAGKWNSDPLADAGLRGPLLRLVARACKLRGRSRRRWEYGLIGGARAWRLLNACAPRLWATACGAEPAAGGALPLALVDELAEGE